MARYIDADAAVKAFCDKCGWYENQCDTDKGFWCESRGLLEEAPAIDIVFCKDCAFTAKRQSKEKGMKYCKIHFGWVKENRFCAWGESKSDA